MVSSGVDSGIAGTLSMYSGLSAMVSSHAKEPLDAKQNEINNIHSSIVNYGHTATDNDV